MSKPEDQSSHYLDTANLADQDHSLTEHLRLENEIERLRSRLHYCELSRKAFMEENGRLQETCSVLLEAIREATDYVYNVPPTDCAQGGCPIDDPNQWREELYRKMIAALRKAEGRE